MLRSFALMTAAAALVAAPVAAQATPQRAAAPLGADSEELAAGSIILPFAVAIGLGLILWLSFDGDDDLDDPLSP